MNKVTFLVGFVLSILLICGCTRKKTASKIAIKVVVVSMFERDADEGDIPGEFQYWVERLPLDKTLPFPAGYRDLRYNEEMGIIGIVTGVGNTKAAVSIQALGSDDRFDLSQAYWLVAGISGVDPQDASTGCAIWADWIIDADLAHEIDAREMPEEWTTGYIPLRKTKPYELPFPAEKEVIAIPINSDMVQWAYNLTKDLELPDNDVIKNMREQYVGYPAASMKPQVMIGAQLAGSTYWHGKLFNQWANEWVSYWTEDKGNFVTSAMEEIGTWHALERLHEVGKVDKNRLLVLRTASNFTMQWPGSTAYESLAGEKISGKGYSAYIPSLESAYIVGSPIVKEIIDNWDIYKNQLPK